MAVTRKDVTAGFKQGLQTLLGLVGIDAVWNELAAPNRTVNLRVGVRTVGSEDEALVNAYGIGAKLLTVNGIDLPVAPVKFDTFTIDGVVFVADSVLPVYLNDSVDRYRVIARSNV